jgi:ubiquinone/menaquinone biosynthesis C-methylase UbiE
MSLIKSIFRQPTCPWWFLFTFDNPLRKLYQNPEGILSPYINRGDTVVDLGCGMGYFSIPAANLVGEHGKVIAVDLQLRMLEGLKHRADKGNLRERINLHQCSQNEIGYSGPADFVLAFWMLHEVHNSKEFLGQIWDMLRNQGRLLIVEPFIHVSGGKFQQTETETLQTGFLIEDRPKIGISRSLLVRKEI